MQKINPFKAGFIIILGVYGFICARDTAVYHFIDGVDLAFHEMGHLMTRPFGKFITILGGTLGQLIVPLSFMLYFGVKKEFYSASVPLFWLGQSFINVSVYIKDARATELPLFGGEDVIHDWNHILSSINMLRYDQSLGGIVYWTGAAIILLSILGGFYFSIERQGKKKSESALHLRDG